MKGKDLVSHVRALIVRLAQAFTPFLWESVTCFLWKMEQIQQDNSLDSPLAPLPLKCSLSWEKIQLRHGIEVSEAEEGTESSLFRTPGDNSNLVVLL